MSEKRLLSRRDFLRGAAMTAVGVLAASCAQPTPQVIEKPVTVVVEKAVPVEKQVVQTVVVEKAVPVEKVVKETVVVEKEVPVEKVVKETIVQEKVVEKLVTPTPLPAKYKEAPMLAELVKAGKLSPVDERLPEEPLVVPVFEKIGKYGGELRYGTLGPADQMIFSRNTEYENLVRWDPYWTKVIPNIAKGWDIVDGGKSFIFHLRKGIKWSDGQPFTADDFVFWYEGASNKELNPNFPNMWTTMGQPVVVRKIDDYTVKFTYTEPYGLFMQQLCRTGSELYWPAHYLKQFFPGYADEAALKAKAKEAGVEYWYEAYGTWSNPRLNPARPVLYAWKYTSRLGDKPQLVAERNPYYWKVDPEGNQLPYIDRQIYTLANDAQAIVMMAIAGEISMQDRHIASLSNKALFAENAEKAGIRFGEVRPSSMNACIIPLNLTHSDPGKRALFQNKDFRIALSHAINRQEIIDVVYLGQGEPYQCAPRPESPLYNEKLAKQYTEYDPALANKILDEIIPNKDAEGFRTLPNGKSLGIVVEVQATMQDRIDLLELVKTYWQAVGIRMAIKPEDRALLFERRLGNDWDAAVWGGDGGMDFMLWPKNYFAQDVGSWFGPAWTAWYKTRGKEGEEPPASMRKQMELYDQLLITPDEETQNELMAEILRIAQEEFWCMGTVLPGPGYIVVKKNLRNVYDWWWSTGGTYPDPAPTNLCTLFWE